MMCPSMHRTHVQSTVGDMPLDVVSASDIDNASPSTEEARDMLTLEMSEVGPEGTMPFAPMMTFQKYLTMQVCVVVYR